jgi:hypothetical protein
MTNHITKIIFLNKFTKDKTIEEIQERFDNFHISNELYFNMLEVIRNK